MDDQVKVADASLEGLNIMLEEGPAAEARWIFEKLSTNPKLPSDTVSFKGMVLAGAKAALLSMDQTLFPTALTYLKSLQQPEGAILKSFLHANMGDADAAVEAVLKMIPRTDKHRLEPTAQAIWSLCIAGQPQRAWKTGLDINEEDPVTALAMYFAAFLIGDFQEQRKWLDIILEQPSYDWLHIERFQKAADHSVLPLNGLMRILMTTGSRIYWSSPKNDQIEALLLHIDPDAVADKQLDQQLIGHLQQGNLVAAAEEFVKISKYCCFAQCMFPLQWINEIPSMELSPAELETVLDISEEMLLDDTMSHESVSLWYQFVWADLINMRRPDQAGHLHLAVHARIQSQHAALNAANKFLAAGKTSQAKRAASKLRNYYGFEDTALAIISRAEAMGSADHLDNAPRAKNA
jgi:hypothetical protein